MHFAIQCWSKRSASLGMPLKVRIILAISIWQLGQAAHCRDSSCQYIGCALTAVATLCSARSILEESKASGLQPDVSNFNTLINCYGKAGQLQAAKAILNELRAHSLPPRLTTYNILMHWYAS